MTLLKGFGTGLCLTALCFFVAPNAKADDLNRKTVVTFSGPVEIPGAQILPAGTYIFKVLDSPADRHIVQISNQDQTHVFATILAIPNLRLKSTNKTVMTFSEQPAGQPEALKAWFYPGRQWGEQFVYERSRAIQLASESKEAVLSTSTALTTAPVEALNTATVEAVNPNGETVDTGLVVEAPPETTEAVAVAPAPAAVAPAPVVVAPEPVAVAPQQVAVAQEPAVVASLPQTASYLPLIGLVGLFSLFGGFAISGLLKRTA